MADVESASSSSTVVQQPSPTSTSHLSPIIPLIAAEHQSDNQQSGVQIQQSNPTSSSTGRSSSGTGLDGSGTTSSSTSTSASNRMDICEPELKKVKLDHVGLGLHGSGSNMLAGGAVPGRTQREEKLESRLGGILCCAVCLDLPKTAMYQVSTFPLPSSYVSSHMITFL